MKGPDGRGLQTKEENMSTFTTIAGLQRLTDRELDFLHRSVLDRLAGHKKARRSIAKRSQHST